MEDTEGQEHKHGATWARGLSAETGPGEPSGPPGAVVAGDDEERGTIIGNTFGVRRQVRRHGKPTCRRLGDAAVITKNPG